ncbi:uncharacterized protein BDV17DRAFT_294256 [Aspergillus undulatus]|uniref:uncharacterized protein n=1 Tax=Aspergillus undulatus TaxID=1810928 RepID=UPI003CCDF620
MNTGKSRQHFASPPAAGQSARLGEVSPRETPSSPKTIPALLPSYTGKYRCLYSHSMAKSKRGPYGQTDYDHGSTSANRPPSSAGSGSGGGRSGGKGLFGLGRSGSARTPMPMTFAPGRASPAPGNEMIIDPKGAKQQKAQASNGKGLLGSFFPKRS